MQSTQQERPVTPSRSHRPRLPRDAPRFQGDGGSTSAGRDPLYGAQSRFLPAGSRAVINPTWRPSKAAPARSETGKPLLDVSVGCSPPPALGIRPALRSTWPLVLQGSFMAVPSLPWACCCLAYSSVSGRPRGGGWQVGLVFQGRVAHL